MIEPQYVLYGFCRFCINGWLVGCFGFNGPLRQYFSLYRAVSQREGGRIERIDESKNVQTTPTRTYCKRSRPLPYYHLNCRTPRHWKITQYHCTTQPPLRIIKKALCTQICIMVCTNVHQCACMQRSTFKWFSFHAGVASYHRNTSPIIILK